MSKCFIEIPLVREKWPALSSDKAPNVLDFVYTIPTIKTQI